MIALLLACAGAPVDSADPGRPTCAELMADGQPAMDEGGVRAKVDAVHAALFPELDGVRIDLVANDDPSSFYAANLDAGTLDAPPLERTYTVVYSTVQFEDPPPHDAVVAILVHELKHIVDYTGMSGTELAEFGIWYATSDVAAYERETDEHALALGCGTGLIAYREWLYAHVDADTAESKRRNYYTPEEIEAWMAAN